MKCSRLHSSQRRQRMRCRSCSPMPEDVRRAADILERRWTVSIIWASHEGAVRFNEFVQSLGQISPSTLAARLRELEEAGVPQRTTLEGPPPRNEYPLTPPGQEPQGPIGAFGPPPPLPARGST